MPTALLRTRTALPALMAAALAASPAFAAEALVATVPGAAFQVRNVPVVQEVVFNAGIPISGVGLTARWQAVVADNVDGLGPWSLDLRATVTSPDGQVLNWNRIGGDRTIAAYPLQDFSGGYTNAQGTGTYSWSFVSPGASNWRAELVNVQYHLTTSVPDVVTSYNGSVASGPTWQRPFFIGGVSGLGPVVYDVIEFQVTRSGGYRFTSVVEAGNNFTYLYGGQFDAATPLAGLLDYGLGNGFGPNGTPQGTSFIETMLFEGETYYYATSQWDRFSPGRAFETTIVGPGGIVIIPAPAATVLLAPLGLFAMRRRR